MLKLDKNDKSLIAIIELSPSVFAVEREDFEKLLDSYLLEARESMLSHYTDARKKD